MQEGYKSVCGKCGARRIDQQFGLEDTPEEFVDKLVDLFRELRRALRHDGVVFLNLGDSYNGSGGAGGDYGVGGLKEGQPKYPGRKVSGLKPKDLIGIPWRCAFALQADGWYLRSEIIWHKRAPMPESVTDRPTKAHEQVFLLSKSPRYFYDAEAIAEASVDPIGSEARYKSAFGGPKNEHLLATNQVHTRPIGMREFNGTRNRRSVWTLGPEKFPGSHFAVMPTALVRPMILAGCPAEVCAACGAPVVRQVEREESNWRQRKEAGAIGGTLTEGHNTTHGNGIDHTLGGRKIITTGFTPTCTCDAGTVPGIVLDPFLGSGTTAAVARSLGRDWLGFELNPDYIRLAEQRIGKTQPPLFAA